jgi:2-methylcitrate synthase
MAAKKPGGLRGITAGKTAICTCGSDIPLSYRGYDILELAEQAGFEEVAYLLLYGELPNRTELDAYKARLKRLRRLPAELKDVLERIPAKTHPMEMLRTGCSMLGALEPEGSFRRPHDAADRLVAVFPSMVCYWYRYAADSVRIETETDDETIGGHFLHMLHGKPPKDLHRKAMDISLNLYAEFEFNPSTFTARVCTSTMSDFHSAITAAIGTLRGPLHGGANEAALELIRRFRTPEEAREGVLAALEGKKRIMGFGHAVYTRSDPRNGVIKKWSKILAEDGGGTRLIEISEAIEALMMEEKKLFPNVDFYMASALHFLGIPAGLFTPIFACSRVPGWSAHIMEQRSDNRIIQPGAEYIGPGPRTFVPIEKRG